MSAKQLLVIGIFTIAGAGIVSCNKPAKQAQPADRAEQASNESPQHDGWWCDEHGVPEEICAQCSITLAPDFKAKGDWCREHDRPDSQCFICHPELQSKFAAQYEARYGKLPPAPDEG